MPLQPSSSNLLLPEALGDLSDERHCVGFLEEGRNNQQGGSKSLEVVVSWFYVVSVD